jgi:hypothetical protein
MKEWRVRLAVAGGVLGVLGTGGIYLAPILLVYVISFYHLCGQTHLTLEDGAWMGPCQLGTTALAGLVAAKLPDYVSPRM